MRAGEVVEGTSVELVSAAFSNVVDHRTRSASVFHTKIVGNDSHFVESVLVTKENRGASHGIVVVRLAINLKVVRATTQSVGRKTYAIRIAEVVASGVRDAGDE